MSRTLFNFAQFLIAVGIAMGALALWDRGHEQNSDYWLAIMLLGLIVTVSGLGCAVMALADAVIAINTGRQDSLRAKGPHEPE